jgi:hypothetical protein
MAGPGRGRLPSTLLLIGISAAFLAAPIALGRSGTEAVPDAAENGRIAFGSDQDGNYEIYSILPDGSDPLRGLER